MQKRKLITILSLHRHLKRQMEIFTLTPLSLQLTLISLMRIREMLKGERKVTVVLFFFGCCVKDNTEDYSTQNGIGVGAANLRSAFSDTLWTNKQKAQQNGALHSNGVLVQNGGRNVKSDKYPGFTFESIRDSQQSIHSTNKDAETGEISNDATFFSIRL